MNDYIARFCDVCTCNPAQEVALRLAICKATDSSVEISYEFVKGNGSGWDRVPWPVCNEAIRRVSCWVWSKVLSVRADVQRLWLASW